MSEESEYYTASQAQAKLGIGKSWFHRLVREGRIPSRPRTKYGKQRVYPKRDIDILASALRSVLEPEERSVFSRSTPSEQEEEMHIGIRAFGAEYITPLPERVGFQFKNEYSFWSLKDDHGHVVGYISMFRFPPDFLDDLLTGRRIEREITVDEVLRFSRQEPFDIYIDVLVVDPNIPPFLRHRYTKEIVSGFVGVILNLLANRYEIRTLYTVTTSKEGDNLVQRRGFRLMKGKSQAPGRTAYEFPLDEQGIKHLQELSGREV